MSANWPIEITNSDIDEVESLMSVKFDESRRLIIKNMERFLSIELEYQ